MIVNSVNNGVTTFVIDKKDTVHMQEFAFAPALCRAIWLQGVQFDCPVSLAFGDDWGSWQGSSHGPILPCAS